MANWSEIVSGPPIPKAKGVRIGAIYLPPLTALPRGVLLGTVRVVDCLLFSALPKRWKDDPFAEPGGYCWIVDNPIALPEPIPCRGALRLWDAPPGLPQAAE